MVQVQQMIEHIEHISKNITSEQYHHQFDHQMFLLSTKIIEDIVCGICKVLNIRKTSASS